MAHRRAIARPSPPHVATAEFEAVRDEAQVLGRRVPDEEREGFARSFGAHAIGRYWELACPAGDGLGGILRCALAIGPLPEIVARRASRAGELAARLDRPIAAYLLGTLYTTLLPERTRGANGVFYTPPALARRLLDMVEAAGARWDRATVLDPAAGGAAFLAPVAERMATCLARAGASADAILAHVATHVKGVEIDPFAAWMSDVFLEAALWDLCRSAKRRIAPLVVIGDALELPDGWQGGFDVVVGNPPYGRVTLPPERRERFARSLFGHANLYGVFTDLALRLVRPGGVVGYVTPASFLAGEYFKNLRALLVDRAAPAEIDFITDRSGVFEQVLQETLLIALRAGRTEREVAVRTVRPRSPWDVCETAEVATHALPADAREPWLLPRDREDARLLRTAAALPHRLFHYGIRVSTGPLVWNRHKDQLRTRKGGGVLPLVWAESVLPGGGFRFRWERRNHTPYFAPRPDQGHLVTREEVVLVQRTTAKEQNRRVVAAVLPAEFLAEHGGAVVENHLNLLKRTGTDTGVSMRALAALLNSEVVDRLFRCISGSVAVSAFELEALPLPPPETIHCLDRLLQDGGTADEVNAFVHRAYDRAMGNAE